MITKGWRTSLIWAGLILFWSLNTETVGYGPEYTKTVGMYEYTYHDFQSYGYFLYILALAFTMTGCYIWTKLKNRHWAFLLWGLLTPIGLLGISLLHDRSEKEEEVVKDNE